MFSDAVEMCETERSNHPCPRPWFGHFGLNLSIAVHWNWSLVSCSSLVLSFSSESWYYILMVLTANILTFVSTILLVPYIIVRKESLNFPVVGSGNRIFAPAPPWFNNNFIYRMLFRNIRLSYGDLLGYPFPASSCCSCHRKTHCGMVSCIHSVCLSCLIHPNAWHLTYLT